MKPVIGHVIYGIEGRASYALAPLDERALFASGPDPDRLLAAGLIPREGMIEAEDLGGLPIVDYELMMAQFAIANFGDGVGQNVNCTCCGKKYAAEFSLGTYADLVARDVTQHDGQDFLGYPLSLPSRDALASAGPDGPAPVIWAKDTPLNVDDIAALEAYLQKACPVLQEDINAPCPDCGTVQSYQFVLRDWVVQKLSARFRNLAAQVHLFAAQYHWRVDEIFDLPRPSRLALIDTIGAQQSRLAPAGPR